MTSMVKYQQHFILLKWLFWFYLVNSRFHISVRKHKPTISSRHCSNLTDAFCHIRCLYFCGIHLVQLSLCFWWWLYLFLFCFNLLNFYLFVHFFGLLDFFREMFHIFFFLIHLVLIRLTVSGRLDLIFVLFFCTARFAHVYINLHIITGKDVRFDDCQWCSTLR